MTATPDMHRRRRPLQIAVCRRFLPNLFKQHNFIPEIIAPALLILTFSLMSLWSWRKWADPLVDFGRELYIPWQLTLGKILYKDIAHLFGPFSQYFNALLFEVFGVSYTTLIFANLTLTAIFTLVIYKTIKDAVDQLCATFVAFAFLTLFAFSQYTGFANFNFVSPYAHEATHGVILAALMIYGLWKFMSTRHARYVIASGLLFGLILLTKIEIIISATATVVVYFAILFKHDETKWPLRLKIPGLFLIATIMPLAVSLVYFLAYLPLTEALKAVGGGLPTIAALDIAGIPFYQISLGTYDLKASMYFMFKTLLWFLIIIAISAVAAIRFINQKHSRVHKGLSFLLLIFMIILAWKMEWIHIGRPLPLFCLVIGITLFAAFEKTITKDREAALKNIPLILWSVFSFFLLIKIFFNGRFYHYGFYQAMPAFLLLVCFLTGYIPRWLTGHRFHGNIFMAFMMIFIGIVILHYMLLSDQIYRAKTLAVGDGHDRFYAFAPSVNPHGLAVSYFLKWAKELPADSTFAVLPEGVMLNYLARKTNPTKYINFMVPEMRVFGEGHVLSDFMDKRPDFIVLVHKDTSEYGEDFFGRDARYGKSIMDWVNQNYQKVVRIGEEPLQDNRFGIKIMKRNKSCPEKEC
jgi:hypothetical protein